MRVPYSVEIDESLMIGSRGYTNKVRLRGLKNNELLSLREEITILPVLLELGCVERFDCS
jgi:hypothetical protein